MSADPHPYDGHTAVVHDLPRPLLPAWLQHVETCDASGPISASCISIANLDELRHTAIRADNGCTYFVVWLDQLNDSELTT